MSFTFQHQDGSTLEFSFAGWIRIMALAQQYGWRPAGTLEPKWGHDLTVPQWDGRYDTGDGQEVTAQDARAIADALAKSLDDIPDNPQPSQIGERDDVDLLSTLGPAVAFGPNPDWTTFGYFGGENKQKVQDFIDFCHKDGFFILP